MPDLRIPEDTIIRTARAINAIEDARDQANEDLKVTWADLREELKSLGLKGAEVSAEVGYLKAAIAETRKTEADHLKAETKAEGMEGYLSILTSPRARARARDNEPQPETAEQSRTGIIEPNGISIDSQGWPSFAGTEGDEGQHPIQPETANQQPETHGSSPCIAAREADRPATYGQLVTGGESAASHSIPASPEPPSTLAGEGGGISAGVAPLDRTSDELSHIAGDAVGYGESDRRADAGDHSNAGGENVAAPDDAETAEAVSDNAANTLKTQAEAGAVDSGAPSHRVMSITPLEPRETGGLKGFGFSVMFEEKPRSSSGLERMPGCKNLDACAGSRTKRCFTCERDWNAKAHEVDA